jgi:thiol-disulfide isomerase/thioredoxin
MSPEFLLSRRSVLLSALASAAVVRASADESDTPLHFVARTMEGEKLTTDSLKGKVVLIEFWATWCQYCKKDEPTVEKLSKEFDKDGLVVVAVDMGEPRKRVKKYLLDNPRTAKMVLAEDTTLAAICNAQSYPLYVLIDRDGTIAGRQNGAAGEQGLRHLLGRAGLGA